MKPLVSLVEHTQAFARVELRANPPCGETVPHFVCFILELVGGVFGFRNLDLIWYVEIAKVLPVLCTFWLKHVYAQIFSDDTPARSGLYSSLIASCHY